MAGVTTGHAASSTRGDGRITDEGIADLRSRIGKNLGNLSRHALVTQEWIDRYALGIGDPNPLWTDPVYGARTTYGTTIAPPSIVFNLGGADVGTGLPGVHSMYTGLEVDWLRPIRPGDDLDAHGYVKAADVKQTQFAGRAVLQVSETVFEDPAHQTVAKLRHFLLRTERGSARERKTILESPLATYTDEALADIERRILRQVTRGDIPRSGASVNVGDELPEVVKGPFSATDEVAWLRGGFGGALEGPFMFIHEFATIWRRRHPEAVIRNAQGFYDSPEAVHWNNELAQRVGVPAAYDIGPQRIAWMLQAVTNWMGDDAFLLNASGRLGRFVVIGDVVFCKGTVAAKRKVERGVEVDIDLTASNQRDEQIATGKAKVLLPA